MEEKSVACIEEFSKLVAEKDCVSLVREWQVHTFYVVFINNGSEGELPALVDVHDHLAFLAGTDPEAVEAELPANDAGPVMAQRWSITSIADGQEVGDAESWLVYDDDDGVILLNPDGSLRNGPKARSAITSAEQALFGVASTALPILRTTASG